MIIQETIKEGILQSWEASFVMGLQKGYSKESIDYDDVKRFIQKWQDDLKDKDIISVKITKCDIVCREQDEPSINISIINYPNHLWYSKNGYRFKQHTKVLLDNFTKLAHNMMDEFEQNRIIIKYPLPDGNYILMLEKSKEMSIPIG